MSTTILPFITHYHIHTLKHTFTHAHHPIRCTVGLVLCRQGNDIQSTSINTDTIWFDLEHTSHFRAHKTLMSIVLRCSNKSGEKQGNWAVQACQFGGG